MDIEKWLLDTTATSPTRGFGGQSSLKGPRNVPIASLRERRFTALADHCEDPAVSPYQHINESSAPLEDVRHDGPALDNPPDDEQYSRRKRRKTRPDRYDPSRHDLYKHLSRREYHKDDAVEKRSARSQRKPPAKGFEDGHRAANVTQDRLTLEPSYKIGIFRRGTSSVPVQLRRRLQDLTFDEKAFFNGPKFIQIEQRSNTDDKGKKVKVSVDRVIAQERQLDNFFRDRHARASRRSRSSQPSHGPANVDVAMYQCAGNPMVHQHDDHVRSQTVVTRTTPVTRGSSRHLPGVRLSSTPQAPKRDHLTDNHVFEGSGSVADKTETVHSRNGLAKVDMVGEDGLSAILDNHGDSSQQQGWKSHQGRAWRKLPGASDRADFDRTDEEREGACSSPLSSLLKNCNKTEEMLRDSEATLVSRNSQVRHHQQPSPERVTLDDDSTYLTLTLHHMPHAYTPNPSARSPVTSCLCINPSEVQAPSDRDWPHDSSSRDISAHTHEPTFETNEDHDWNIALLSSREYRRDDEIMYERPQESGFDQDRCAIELDVPQAFSKPFCLD